MDNAPIMQRKALLEVGDRGENASYELALPLSASGGAFAVAFTGYVTAPLLRFALPDDVQAALEALPSIGGGNAKVSGARGGPFRIQMSGALGAQFLPPDAFPLTADGSGLTPPATLAVVPLLPGRAPTLQLEAATIWDEYSQVLDERLRFLYLKRDLLFILLGESQKGVDAAVGLNSEKLSQQHGNLLRLLAQTEGEINVLLINVSASGHAPVSGRIAKRTPNGLPYGMLGMSTRDGRLS